MWLWNLLSCYLYLALDLTGTCLRGIHWFCICWISWFSESVSYARKQCHAGSAQPVSAYPLSHFSDTFQRPKYRERYRNFFNSLILHFGPRHAAKLKQRKEAIQWTEQFFLESHSSPHFSHFCLWGHWHLALKEFQRFDEGTASLTLGKPKLITLPDAICSQAVGALSIHWWCLGLTTFKMPIDSQVWLMYPDSIWKILG